MVTGVIRSGIQATDVSLSLIWTQPLTALFDGKAPGDLARFATRQGYISAFNAGLVGPGIPTDVTLPWPRPIGQGFWSRYLSQPRLNSLSGRAAWAGLVPVRLGLGAATLPTGQSGRLVLEAYVYPGGLAIVATYRTGGSIPLNQLIDRLDAMKRATVVGIAFGGSTISERLPEVVDRLIDAISRSRFGLAPISAAGALDAFTICTVIDAGGSGVVKPVTEGQGLHRILNGLATWSPTWTADRLPLLADTALNRASGPPSNLVVTSDRGRTIWFPDLFGAASSRRHTLSCYHRNQVFLALMADACADLLQAGASELDAGRSFIGLPLNFRDSISNAAATVVALYGGDQTTYRSRSATKQLEANRGKQAYNRIAPALGLKPIP